MELFYLGIDSFVVESSVQPNIRNGACGALHDFIVLLSLGEKEVPSPKFVKAASCTQHSTIATRRQQYPTSYSRIQTPNMERKRKLPARAARVEGVSKKRTSTPPEHRIQTPTPPVPPPIVEESLPKSIMPGKPLPTVDEPQPENLPSKDFQSVSER